MICCLQTELFLNGTLIAVRGIHTKFLINMKLFKCDNCGQLLYFENSRCVQCGHQLGFLPHETALYTLKEDSGNYTIWGESAQTKYRYCNNHQYNVCNWLIPADSDALFCKACSFNRTIPDISNPEYRLRWNTIENAKHRLIYSLLRLKLPLRSKREDEETGLLFDFMADEEGSEQRILTGHDNGVVTLNISEADDIEREMTRKSMDEVYRTVLGHFRHEVGHYYWDRLIDNSAYIDEYRVLFGDERKDYGEALQAHYKHGAPKDWNKNYISAYATTHSWEDWAETWAHYLHIIDTVETAYAFGMSVHPAIAGNAALLHADINIDPYETPDFNKVLTLWFPLTFALNSLNRSMGLHDLYPFVIPPKVIEKLLFIHKVCFGVRK